MPQWTGWTRGPRVLLTRTDAEHGPREGLPVPAYEADHIFRRGLSRGDLCAELFQR